MADNWAQCWQAQAGKEFRDTVILRTMMLGFSAEEYVERGHQYNGKSLMRWAFVHENKRYVGYMSAYTAAMEYLRLSGLTLSDIGV